MSVAGRDGTDGVDKLAKDAFNLSLFLVLQSASAVLLYCKSALLELLITHISMPIQTPTRYTKI